MTSSTASIITQAIQESNQKFFSQKRIQVALLKKYPQVIPILVEWIYAEWRSYDPSLNKEKLFSSFNHRLNDDRLPFTVVAIQNGNPIGTVSLKAEEDPELTGLSDGNPWLGSLQVVKEEQHKGIGQELLKLVLNIASELGYHQLFLYTSNPENVGWYCKRGATLVEKRLFRDHMITVMQTDCMHA